MSKPERKLPEFYINLSALWELMITLLMSIMFLIIGSHYFNIYDLNELSGKLALVLMIIIISYGLYQMYLGYHQIKTVKFKYRMLKDYPQLVGKNPSWDEIIHQAIIRVEKAGQKVQYFGREIVKFREKTETQKNRYIDLIKEWEESVKRIKQSLIQTLVIDISHLKEFEYLFPDLSTELAELRQKLEAYKNNPDLSERINQQFWDYIYKKVQPVKNEDELNRKAFYLMILPPFLDDVCQATLAGEITRTILLYGEKIQAAEKIIAEYQPKIDLLHHKVNQILTQAEKNEVIIKQLGDDLQILKEIADQLQSEKLKPRELRQIEYNLDKIINEHNLAVD